jgi:hypothetical protein
MILAAIAVNAADLWLSWTYILAHGAGEANPLMAGALSLGLLGGLALKASLLAVVLAAAALKPRRARLLIAAVTVAGGLGALSAVVA